MPIFPRGLRRLSSSSNERRLQADRSARQIEQYYRNQGYSGPAAEQMTKSDSDLVQRLNKQKRGLRNVKLSGTDN